MPELTDRLNKTYEFDIPSAVVKTSLGKLDFISKTSIGYTVDENPKIDNLGINEKQEKIASNNEFIIKELFKFVEDQKQITLNDKEKSKIYHSFSSFLLDESNGDDYIEFITAFILERESVIEFKNQLNLIREGVLLYSGIKYNSNLNEVGSWKTELTIYIGTEILFYLAGYNGELYKSLVLDFLNYVREINDKSNKRLIKLCYFVEVKKEVDRFFGTASKIVEGYIKPKPDGSAMLAIIEGCKKPSDVKVKQADFYTVLKSFFIEEDSFKNYFDPQNFQYNILSKETINKTSDELERETENPLIFLNYISIHRKNSQANNFENIGCILLTGKGTTLNVAWNDLLKDKGQVPLATNLSFLTNKFWFKLNKGFGKNGLPNSFNVITKAQIVLSKILDNSVGDKYRELQNQFKKGVLTEEQVKGRILYLRGKTKNPEEIKNSSVKEVLGVITEDSLENFVEEQTHFKIKAAKESEENVKLREEFEQKRGIEDKLYISKQETLNEKLKQKALLIDQQENIDIDSTKKFKNFKLILTISTVGFTVTMLYFAYKMWTETENWTFILVTLLPIASYYIYMLWAEKEFSPLEQLQKRKDRIFNNNYEKFNFDKAKLELLNNEIIQLEVHIKMINK